MCYIFKALKNQRLLNAGDTIALGTPIFTPYLEMPVLEDYGLNTVDVSSREEDHFQLNDEDFEISVRPESQSTLSGQPGQPVFSCYQPRGLGSACRVRKDPPPGPDHFD